MKKMILVSIILAILFIGVFALGSYIGQIDNAGLFTLTNITVTAKPTPTGDSMTYKLGGSNYDDYTTEKLSLSQTNNTSNVLFNYFTGSVKKNKLTYSLSFYSGINFSKSDSNVTETWVENGTKDMVKIPFMGKTYNINKINFSENKIQSLELLDSAATKSYSIGEKIEGLVGKDGKSYYATIDGVIYSSTDPTTVKMTLYNAETKEIVTWSTKVKEGETFDTGQLETSVEVNAVDNFGTQDIPEYSIKVTVGKAIIIFE